MKEKLSLVIMAAGMGSRYGGLKQLESVGPNNEIIIDYSIYDAIKAGFSEVVFVIREEHYELFKEIIGNRISKKIKVNYAFQNINDVPSYVNYEGREKPWGTLHAINAAKKFISGKFAVINADDYYGAKAFVVLADNLRKLNSGEALCVTYKYNDTKSKNGTVKRGICQIDNGLITNLVECQITEAKNVITASPLNGDNSFEITKNTLVSMNMFGFNKSFYSTIENYLQKFFLQNDYISKEILLPEVVQEELLLNNLKLLNIPSNSVWCGITYKEDLASLKAKIKELTNLGMYEDI